MVPPIYDHGAMRRLAPAHQSTHEVGLVLEFIASEPELARTASAVNKQNLLHNSDPGCVITAANLAFCLKHSECDCKGACRFVLYDVMKNLPIHEFF